MATYIDQEGRHNHILRLHINRTVLDITVCWIACWLPYLARQWIQGFLPGPFLPPIVIIKKLKPTWDAEFENEKRIYQQLQPLQGHAIPVFYGEGSYDGTRAFLLSDVGSVSLYEEQVGDLSQSTIKKMLKPALKAILALGVEPADQNPRNYHLIGDAVFVLDFEDTAVVDPMQVEELADAIADGVAHWTAFYHKNNRR